MSEKLKLIFERMEWQSRENRNARKAGEQIAPDGVEWETCAVHFPKDFLRITILEKEFIRLQHVHKTRRTSVNVFGTEVPGANTHDMFFQLVQYGLNLIDNEKDKVVKAALISKVIDNDPLPRIDRDAEGRRVRKNTQTTIQVSKELFARVGAFQEQNGARSKANVFYRLCLLALDSFSK